MTIRSGNRMTSLTPIHFHSHIFHHFSPKKYEPAGVFVVKPCTAPPFSDQSAQS